MTKGNELFAVTNAHGSVSTGKDKKVNCTWKKYLIGHPPIEYLWLYEKLSLYNIRKKLKIETLNKMYKRSKVQNLARGWGKSWLPLDYNLREKKKRKKKRNIKT